MHQITIAGISYKVNPRLENFNLQCRPSSNIAFFGTNPKSGSLFVQFKSGGTYIYSGVTPDAAIALINAVSIGKAINTTIVGKFPSEKLETPGLYKIEE